jgi:hypothetical protein
MPGSARTASASTRGLRLVSQKSRLSVRTRAHFTELYSRSIDTYRGRSQAVMYHNHVGGYYDLTRAITRIDTLTEEGVS